MDTTVEYNPQPRFSPQAYLQLFRLGNVFTAVADVLLGYLLTHASLQPGGVVAALIGASCLLYTSGMVLNDVFDLAVDARDRPFRPIPSGRVQLRLARLLGFELMLFGVGAGFLAGYLAGTWRCGIIALLLAINVLLYDTWMKRSWMGPLAMGGCRFLNVVLGMSALEGSWHGVHFMISGGIGIYIAGVTWFARTEAIRSSRGQLALATGVMIAGIALVGSFPDWVDDGLPAVAQPIFDQVGQWRLLLGMLAVLIGWRCLAAVMDPVPQKVQTAVRLCLMSLVVLDASICVIVRGTGWSLVILALLVPTVLLGRWLPST